MAPGKKKKKVTANPARGFATVSQPSKAKVVNLEPDTTDASATAEEVDDEAKRPASGGNGEVQQPQHAATDIQKMTPEELEAHLEDEELRQLAKMHGDRCKVEASRQVAKLVTERRQLRSQFNSSSEQTSLSDDLIGDVIDLQASPIESTNLATASKLQSKKHIQQEALLLKLWSLKQVLMELGVPDVDNACEYIIEQALHGSISDAKDYLYGLAEAFEWYGIASTHNDIKLPDYSASEISNAIVEDDPDEEDTVIPESNPEHKIDAREVIPQDAGAPLTDSSSDNDTTPEDEDDPNQLVNVYVKAKSSLLNIELTQQLGQIGKSEQRKKQRAQAKIEALQRDILFDKEAAELAWLPVSYQLKGTHAQAMRNAKSRSGTSTPATQGNGASRSGSDDENGSPGMELGDIFSEPKHPTPDSVTKISAEGPSITLLNDFGKWQGQHPRKLLEETCKSVDGGSKLAFSTLSATISDHRHRLRIQWESSQPSKRFEVESLPYGIQAQIRNRSWILTMKEVAARDRSQSEAYLSVLMLFLLIAGSPRVTSSTIRMPSIWREVFTDLLDKRKRLVTANDTTTLKNLRKQIDEAERKAPQTQQYGLSDSVFASLPSRTKYQDSRLGKIRFDDTRAKHEWETRAARRSFQDFFRVRSTLPVYQYKAEILETIGHNSVTIICADTGSGKSTQIPGYVLEDKLLAGQDCHILVTQPRRISAISLARRVSQELGESKADLGTDRSLIGYAIRLESKMSSTTRITYATTGVLLRMLEESFDLANLDVLVLDEVHERTLDLDLLFIALRRLIRRRSTLKVILMSATIDAKSFSDYFDHAPILNLPGRTYPVDVRYLEDAVESTLDVKYDGSRTDSPPVTDDEDDEDATNMPTQNSDVVPDGYKFKTKSVIAKMDMRRIDYGLLVKLCVAIATKAVFADYSKAILIFMPGIGEIRRLSNALAGHPIFTHGWVVHQLHSTFSTDELERAFIVPPPGQRKVVIATNIAETGITIPDVTCVIDTCKEKVMRFNERRQLSRLTEGFIARASARQRKGRAARVQKGLCFHLVTKHRYEHLMPEQNEPEIQRLSLQDPTLRVKLWQLGSIEDTLSEAIEPPNAKNITRAIQRLKEAGALTTTEELTRLGRKAARLPMEMPLAKLAILGTIFKCLDAAITIIALMSSKSPFLSTGPDSRANFKRGDSDLITNFYAYQCWKNARVSGKGPEFCRKAHLSDQTMNQVEDQKIQLVVYLVDAGMLSLSNDEHHALNRARATSHRRDFYQIPPRYNIYSSDAVINSVIAMSFFPRILVREGKGWRNIYTNQTVTLTPRSINHFSHSRSQPQSQSSSLNTTTSANITTTSTSSSRPPRYLSFHSIHQSSTGHLNAFETSAIPEPLLPLSLGLSASFKLFSGVVSIDNGKLRVAFREWKSIIALKILRERVGEVMERWYKDGEAGETEEGRKWLGLWARVVNGEAVG